MMQSSAVWLPNEPKDIGVLRSKTPTIITTWSFEGMQSHNPLGEGSFLIVHVLANVNVNIPERQRIRDGGLSSRAGAFQPPPHISGTCTFTLEKETDVG